MQSKALGTLLATLGVAAISWAQQVPFQVAGPQNGATVRETVKIRIPRMSLEGVKYLSLGVDGKFRAGVMVPAPGQKVETDLIQMDKAGMMVTLLWNTKAKVKDESSQQVFDGVDDGPHTLELIAYDASNKKLGKQTLTLTVNNRGDLRMPADGIALAYRFAVGEQSQYKQRTDLEYVNDVKTPENTIVTQRRSGYYSQGRGQGGFSGGGGGLDGGEGGFPGSGKGGGMSGSGMPGGMMGSGGMQGRRGGGSGSLGMPGGGMSGSGMPGGMMPGGGSGMPGGMMPGGMMGGGMPGGMMGGGGGSNPFDNMPVGAYRIPVQTVKANYIRTTEDRINASDFFIRDKVQDGTIVSPAGGAARLQDIYDFKSRYRTVASSGKVLDHGIANGARPGAYVALPMIELGGKRRIGQKWTTMAPILLEWATLDTPTQVPCTNVLEGLEWESGYQCAKIHQTYNAKANVQIFGGAGKIQGAKIKMDRIIWFSYKAGKIIKTETVTEVEGDTPSDILSAMVPQAGVGGGMGGGMMGGGGLDGEGMGGMMMGSGFPGGGGKGGGMMPGGMMPGGGGDASGFGGMQGGQQMEAPKVPAKFRSTTVVELVVAPPVVKTASATTTK
ncbi:hypothetical protein [Armatimonas rosea]|uniref:Uncharacterized protein n=1 Tax=Armatimonas rosea TaxID=685828 RepID=A0A7W9W5N0_ARMRO|nr:hypothetical protein [Armatimonas rosea]MBB6049231.1 hypothetical protein [Armatimonas rosea]